MHKNDPIGIFDSGVGGVSVLRTARALLPRESFIYYGDTANAPYGTKTEAQVVALSRRMTQRLLDQGIKALVIACNTATCAAAQTLREENPGLIIIGMEPALKLAHDRRPGGSAVVMATPVSLQSRKYQTLYSAYGKGAVSLPCPGLMELVERGVVEGELLDAYLTERLRPWLPPRPAPDCVVLGCTHYVFLRRAIARRMPAGTLVLDGNDGTACQLQRRLAQAGLLCDRAGAGDITLMSSADEKAVALMRALLELPA